SRRFENDHDAGRRVRSRGGFHGIHQGHHHMIMETTKTITGYGEPYAVEFSPATCALLIIDMQRDFLEPGGFGEMLGNDVWHLRAAIEPSRGARAAWRSKPLPVMHTREGHRPDLTDLPPAKKIRGRGKTTIGDEGP